MRSLDKKRRALFKNHYIFGTAKNVSGTDSVEIKSGSGTPLKSLEIKGLTEQKIELDQFKKYAEYFKNPDNYIDSGTTSIWVIPFPNEWLGKELTFSLSEKTKMTDITFGVSDGTSLFANSKTLLDSSGNVLSVTSSAYSYFRFTGVLVDNLQKISEFWNSYELTVNGLLVDFPEPLKNANDNGIKITLGERAIKVPASVEVGGKAIDLRLGNISIISLSGVRYTATDYLTIDGANKKVLYHQNLGKETLTSDMNWGILTYNEKKYFWLRRNIGAGYNGVVNLSDKYQGMIGVGAILKYDFGITADCGWYGSSWKNVVSVRDARFDNLEDFLADLSVNPIELEYGLLEEKVHDLTETDFGRELLSLCSPRTETSILQVNGGLAGIPIKLEYYSREEAETVTLTIKYVDENGNEIKEPRVNNTRKGSKYLIIAPHIDGYKRVSTEVYGVSDEDTEIELLYRK